MKTNALTGAIIKTALTFIVLVVLIVGYLSSSFGWFAKNDSVKGSGISVSVEGISVEITQISSAGGVVDNDSLSVAFSNLCPGDTVTVSVEITCYKELESLSVSLCAPQGCETPVQSEGKNYYFGSQIIMSSVLYNGEALGIDAVGKSLMSNEPENGWGVTGELVPTDIAIHSVAPLTVGKHYFDFQFTFYNAPYNQNVLKNFGQDESQVCYREISIE
jgi:hypothetical protein